MSSLCTSFVVVNSVQGSIRHTRAQATVVLLDWVLQTRAKCCTCLDSGCVVSYSPKCFLFPPQTSIWTFVKLEQSTTAAGFLGGRTAALSLVHGEGGSSFEILKKIIKVTQAKRPNSLAEASCNDKVDELIRLKTSRLVSRSHRQCFGRVFGCLLLKLTWCDNGIQSEAAVAGSGCFPLVACSMVGSCLQLAFAAVFKTDSKWERSLCMIHDVQTYLKSFRSALISSAFSGWVEQAGIKAMLVPRQW